MPHEIIDRTGAICYRTKLVDLNTARSFALCVQANESRFQSVEIMPSRRSKSDKFFVTFQPRSETRLDDMRAAQQAARQHRAETQEFLFWPSVRPGFDHCFSVTSGNFYLVSATSCNCPDQAQFGARRARLVCKHRLARQIWIAQEMQEMRLAA